MNVIRIDTNALKWLIESQGEEFKLELSRSVLAEAAKTVVRGIVPEKAEEVIKAAAEAEVAEQIGRVEGGWNNRKVIINSDVQKEVQSLTRREANKMVEDVWERCREYMDHQLERYFKAIRQDVERRFEKVRKEEIEAEISRRFQEILTKSS